MSPGPSPGHGRSPLPAAAIAGGANGIVTAAARARDGRRVALKRAATACSRPSLERELELLGRLRHPHLIRLEGWTRDPTDGLVLVERLIDGPSLGEWTPTDPREVQTVLAQVASCLAYLHASGVVHGDVKPANVLVETAGAGVRAVIIDLGSAAAVGTSCAGGTPGFLAPEILAGGLLAPAADLYALGRTIDLIRPPGAEQLAALAVRLQSPEPARRPDALQVLRLLGGAMRLDRELVLAQLAALPHARDGRRAAWSRGDLVGLLTEVDPHGVFVTEWSEALVAAYGGDRSDTLAALARMHSDETVDLMEAPWHRLPPDPERLPPLPASLLRLRRRLSRAPLSAGARRTLLVLALATEPIPGHRLARVARASRGECAEALRLCRHARARTRARRGHGHRLRSTAARAELVRRSSSRQLRRAHRRIAAELRVGARDTARHARAVEHLVAAGMVGLALRELALVGPVAAVELEASSVHDWAQRLTLDAARRPGEPGDVAWRLEVLRLRLTAAEAAGRLREVRAAAGALLELDGVPVAIQRRAAWALVVAGAPAGATGRFLAHLAPWQRELRSGLEAWRAGDSERAHAQLGALTSLPDVAAQALRDRLLAQLGARLWPARDFAAPFEQLVRRALASGLRDEAVASSVDLGRACLDRGRVDEARAAWHRAAEMAGSGAWPRTKAAVASLAARLARERGDTAEALRHYRGALAWAQLAGEDRMVDSLANGAGVAAKRSGDRAAAERWYRLAHRVATRAGDPLGAVPALLNLAVLMRDQGRYDEAALACEQVASTPAQPRTYLGKALAILADTRLRQGRVTECREIAARADEHFESAEHLEGRASVARLVAECDLQEGDLHSARESIALASRYASRAGSAPAVAEARELELRHAMCLEDRAAVRRLGRDCAASLGASADPRQQLAYELAMAGWWLEGGELEPGRARPSLQRAATLLDEAMPPFYAEEHRRLQALLAARMRIRARRERSPAGPRVETLGASTRAGGQARPDPHAARSPVGLFPDDGDDGAAGIEALLAHAALLARRHGARQGLLVVGGADVAAVECALEGIATVRPLPPRQVTLAWPGGAGDTALADAWRRLEGVAPAPRIGWAFVPDDGAELESLLAAAGARGGAPPPRADRAVDSALCALGDVPRGDMQSMVLALLSRLTEAPISLEQTLRLALELAAGAVGARRGFLILDGQGPAAGDRFVAACGGASAGELVDPGTQVSRSVLERVLATGEPALFADAAQDPELGSRQSVRELAIRSLLCVPVEDDAGRLGALYLDDNDAPRSFGDQDLQLAQAFARRAAGFLRRVRDAETAERRLEILRQGANGHPSFPQIVGASPALRELLDQLQRLVHSDVRVLITGESGTGKELVAAALHRGGARASGPFVPINCSALPETLLESELFGHASGSFSGATRERAGLLEAASGGTLFLDEVGELSPTTQARLLRALETGRIRRLGETRERAVDVRVVSATHRDLEAMVALGDFREDLLYRLRVVSLHVPPLRERGGDLPLLVASILREACTELGRTPPLVTPATMAALARYGWPGNVRELVNEMRRALVFATDRLDVEHLSDRLRAPGGDVTVAPGTGRESGVAAGLRERFGEPLAAARDSFTRAYLEDLLARHGGVVARAARAEGTDRGQLHRLLKRHGLR